MCGGADGGGLMHFMRHVHSDFRDREVLHVSSLHAEAFCECFL